MKVAMLSESLENQARYFDGLAEEWQHDHHRVKASRVRALAAYVATLGEEDSRLRVLDDVGVFNSGDVAELGSTEFSAYLGQLHRGHEVPSRAALEHLVSCAVADLRSMMDGVDPRQEMADESRAPLWRLCALGVVRDECESLEGDLVARARARGASWGVIGQALGRSRQGLQRRYGDASE